MLKQWEKGLLVLIFSLLAAQIAWLFYSNFLFSDNYDFIVIRNFDDIGYHKVLASLRNLIKNGDWSQALSRTESAYGAFFWIPMTLLTLLFADNPDLNFITIAIPRMVSLLSYVMCLFAFYRICRLKNITPLLSAIGTLFVTTLPLFIVIAGLFHNHLILTAFFIWSCYFLLLPPTRRRLVIASCLMGIAIGIKLTALSALPVFLALLNSHRNQKNHVSLLLKNLVAFLLITLSALIAFSPTFFLLLIGDTKTFHSSIGLLRARFNIHSPLTQIDSDLFGIIKNVYCISSIHYLILIIGVLATFYLFYKKKGGKSTDKTFSLIALVSLFLILNMCYWIHPSYLMIYYTPPLTLIFMLIYVEAASHHKSGVVVLLGLVIANIFLNFNDLADALTKPKRLYYSESTRESLKKYETYREQFKFSENDHLLVYYSAVFPQGLLKNYKQCDYVFEYPEVEWQKYTAFVFVKNSDLWRKPCEELHPSDLAARENCQIGKTIMAAEPPYIKVIDDDVIRVVRNNNGKMGTRPN